MFHITVLKVRFCMQFEKVLVLEGEILMIRLENGSERKKMV